MSVKEARQKIDAEMDDDNVLVYAPPESSGDESDRSAERIIVKSTQSDKITAKKAANSFPKRPANTAASARPKRQKLKDDPSLETIVVPDDSTSLDLLFGFPSTGSQKRRLKQTYAKKHLIPPPVGEDARLRETKHGLQVPDAFELPEKETSKSMFIRPDEVPELNSPKRKRRKLSNLVLPGSPEDTRVNRQRTAEFRVPDALEFSSSGGTESRSIPDVFDSPETKARRRSGSVSSLSSKLSSVDDMVILAYNDDYKVDLAPEPSKKVCPVCEKPVHDSATLFVPDDLHTLPFKRKQKFCHDHKVADAKNQWDERKYPKIYWEEVENFRIPEKLAMLREIVSRQRTCSYLDELDSQVTALKGNKRKIQRYLNEGLIDVAKIGYYGPKGAHIMANAISASLTQALSTAVQSDSALREVGVGAYVDAVLVPELTLQLVMEDMNLKTIEDGKRVLNESTAIGELLHPEEDKVEVDDAEEV